MALASSYPNEKVVVLTNELLEGTMSPSDKLGVFDFGSID